MASPGWPLEELVGDVDEFDLPVIVRRATPLAPRRRPSSRRLNGVARPWLAGPPATSGDYVTTMTWRNLLDAAMTVGRDVAPWLLRVPGLAWQEVVARESPLRAFLVREHSPLMTSPTGWALRSSVVYTDGTERTAQAAFGYRLGMTMAEWVARGLCGLSATRHCEDGLPTGAPAGWAALRSQPDLYCSDLVGATWLVEAEGGRRPGLPELRKGASQVETAATGFRPLTINAVVGASLEHMLYATLDFNEFPPPAVRGAAATAVSDEEALLAAVRARMLAYAVLIGTPADRQSLRIAAGVPAVGPRTAASPLRSLEQDDRTRVARSDRAGAPDSGRGNSSEVTEYLVADVPGAGLALGLSREMFAACATYGDQVRELDVAAESRMPVLDPDRELEQPALEERRDRKDQLLSELRHERMDVLRRTVTNTFEQSQGASWERLTRRHVDYDDNVTAPEAASSAAYLSARAPF